MSLIQQWWNLYQDPMFWQFPIATLLLGVITFLLIATPWTLLAWIDPDWAKPYKIQQKPFQVRRYFLPNLARIIVNTTIMAFLLFLFWPVIRLSGIHEGNLPAWYAIALQLVFFIFLDDYLFYWMHRWLHENKWMLRHVHSVHHRIKNTCALDGTYFHWLEYVLISTLAMIGPLIVGCHLYVLYAWIIIRNIEAADGHAGYDFPWNPLRYLPFYDGPVYHDFHHARFKGNYAGALHYVDSFYGTYIKEYLAYKQQKKQSTISDSR